MLLTSKGITIMSEIIYVVISHGLTIVTIHIVFIYYFTSIYSHKRSLKTIFFTMMGVILAIKEKDK